MKNSKPKVSVVTITYAHEKYIEDTLRGVLMQQYDGPIEFIIANDNSPDQTDEVVKNFFETHPVPENIEIKYTCHQENKGMMPNFIWALEQATGEYIAFCEGDDYWTDPLKLQKQVDFLENNVDFVACGCYVKTERFGRINESEVINAQLHISVQRDLVYHNPFWTLTTVFRNKNLKNLLDYKFVLGDTELFLYLSQFGKFCRLPFIGGVYRYHGSGVISGGEEYTNKKRIINSKISAIKYFDLDLIQDLKKLLKKEILGECLKSKYLLVGKYNTYKSLNYIIFCTSKFPLLKRIS